ncbi:BZ3500_MvSof-1268-A1-R1_Chr9g10440 [Microbotryum saponariae]|uniref:Autophagy-related protein 4 n=1 Tax=Microbotryum saponariae TaxID=289078 RepID=A0A2X0KTK8_9BASI|nr:BZ3501_MvSof-1269-A2-R1_Chr9g10190 [Microbotryum saponariae]SDA00096.1 BZ3500_MvSof-1268-A1-R1_Chr9g10440 [Microbotryum saponariae]
MGTMAEDAPTSTATTTSPEHSAATPQAAAAPVVSTDPPVASVPSAAIERPAATTSPLRQSTQSGAGLPRPPAQASSPPRPWATSPSPPAGDNAVLVPRQGDRPKPQEHDIVLVDNVNHSSNTGHDTSLQLDPNLSSAGSSSNKLTRWLSRGSTESSTSSSSIKNARRITRRASATHPTSSTQDPRAALVHPTISISSSSSAHSPSSSRSASPIQTLRSSLSSEKDKESKISATSRALSSLSFKNVRNKGKGSAASAHDGELEDWAETSFDDGATSPFDARLQAAPRLTTSKPSVDAPPPPKNGVGRFSLRKTRSKLFGRPEAQDEREFSIPEELVASSPTRRVNKASTASNLGMVRKKSATWSTESLSRSQELEACLDPDFNPRASDSFAPSASSEVQSSVGGRIGGWFNSIINNETLTSTSPAGNDPPSPMVTSRALPPLSKSTSPGSASSSPSRASPPKRGSATALNTNRSGGRSLGPFDRFLDKTAQFLFDSDSHADKCEDEIWVLGVCHQAAKSEESSINEGGKTSPRPSRPSEEAVDSEAVNLAPSSSTTSGWPSTFYHDFYSRMALTYRSGFPPIPCASPGNAGGGGFFNSLSMSIGRGANGRTADGLSSDTGWGCMLRTGQSLLANALMAVHLGRGELPERPWEKEYKTCADTSLSWTDWRRPLPTLGLPSPTTPSQTHASTSAPAVNLPPSFATYARILSLFIDDPSPLAPFSVHRFALTGKQLGKEVGEWFGPSTAMGAIKSLVHDFPPAGLSVVGVNDGTVYRSEVEAASSMPSSTPTSEITTPEKPWQRPVLVLLGLRLGIEGVNPVYHEAIKAIFRFPQSVGIAGGRPSSSYYFVGAQANSLIYIDPHHPKPSIPLRHPPPELFGPAQSIPISSSAPLPTTPTTVDAESFVSVHPPTLARPDPQAASLSTYFLTAYPDPSLSTYHCDKVRKMAITSLDPSMLVGFLIKDEKDWDDFVQRTQGLTRENKPIFSIADSPPAWMRKSMGGGSTLSREEKKEGSRQGKGKGSKESTEDVEVLSADEFSEPDDWDIESDEGTGSGPAVQENEVETRDGAPTPPSLGSDPQESTDDWIKEESTDEAVAEARVIPAVEEETWSDASLSKAGGEEQSIGEGVEGGQDDGVLIG